MRGSAAVTAWERTSCARAHMNKMHGLTETRHCFDVCLVALSNCQIFTPSMPTFCKCSVTGPVGYTLFYCGTALPLYPDFPVGKFGIANMEYICREEQNPILTEGGWSCRRTGKNISGNSRECLFIKF